MSTKGSALWASSGRPLPHMPQPYQLHKSPFSHPLNPTTTSTRALTTHSSSFQMSRYKPSSVPRRKFTAAAPESAAPIPNPQEALASVAKKAAKPHDGTKLYPRDVWEGLVTESTVKLNKYLEIIAANDRRASGVDNNRQMWASQRISPAILHDRFRYITNLPATSRSQALLSLWLSAADFKSRLPPQSLAVNAWLSSLILLVMTMVSAGGVTRLTRSGLSMTTWKFTGEKRPVTEEDWEEEFNLYKQSPEFRIHNADMEIKDFKFIYHMEYGHRTLGRLIGVAFVVPLLFFIANKSISIRSGFGKALVGVLSLGGVQGLIGWWMVKSGLDEKTNVEKAQVSPYRLATHLTIAFTLLVGLTVLKLRARHGIIDVYLADKLIPKKLPHLLGFAAPKRLAHATAMIAFFTAMTGAFVAGNDAGLVYNEWPEMGEGYIPGDLVNPYLSPLRNIFENPTFVQFVHRNLAYTTFTLSWLTTIACMFNPAVPGAVANSANRTAFLVTCQAMLGIYTLLNHVPIEAAALHQFGAMLVLMSATNTMFYTLNPVACVANLSSSIRALSYNQAAGQAKLDDFQSRVDSLKKTRTDLFSLAGLDTDGKPLPKPTPGTAAGLAAEAAGSSQLGGVLSAKAKGTGSEAALERARAVVRAHPEMNSTSLFSSKASIIKELKAMQTYYPEAAANANAAAATAATTSTTPRVPPVATPVPPTAAAVAAAATPTPTAASAAATISKVNKSAAGLVAIVGLSMMVTPSAQQRGYLPTPRGSKSFFD